LEEHSHQITAEPRNPHVHHEPGDVNAIFLTKFGIFMALLIVVFCFGLWGLFDYFAKREAELGPPPFQGVDVTAQKAPPTPRLQPAPRRDFNQMRAAEDEIITEYAWVDPDQGIVRIPIDRAMDLIAQRGLPVRAEPHIPAGGTGLPLGIEAAGGALNRDQPPGKIQ
jgi:hypothetical protein